jgi:hypothetical protein
MWPCLFTSHASRLTAHRLAARAASTLVPDAILGILNQFLGKKA